VRSPARWAPLLAASLAVPLLAGCGLGGPARPQSMADAISVARPASGLAGRISTARLSLPTAVRALVPGYNELATWNRIDTAPAPDGTIYVAWDAADGVHVAHLSAARRRLGADVVIRRAHEVSGLVGQDDGFAILTRRPGRNVFGDTEAHLLRYRGTRLAWDRQLTSNADGDSAPVLDGALAWNGHRYGAYFVVHGVSGPAKGHYGDKLVYVSPSGRLLPGGWPWGCSHNEGIELAPRAAGPFASLCFEDWRSGLFISTGIGAPNNAPVIGREQCWAGYCGGQFGGLVRLASGRFAVAFGTRGAVKSVPDGTGRGYIVTPRFRAHQLAFAVLNSAASRVVRKKSLLSVTPRVDHVDVRLAPYGGNRLLLSYEDVRVSSCHAGTCLGAFAGTYLQVLTAAGQKVGAAVRVPEVIAGQIGVLPGGRLVWAYAPVRPDYARPIYGPTGVRRSLEIAELRVS
jgi:hypothetical protein